jgi:hypothetical protein
MIEFIELSRSRDETSIAGSEGDLAAAVIQPSSPSFKD